MWVVSKPENRYIGPHQLYHRWCKVIEVLNQNPGTIPYRVLLTQEEENAPRLCAECSKLVCSVHKVSKEQAEDKGEIALFGCPEVKNWTTNAIPDTTCPGWEGDLLKIKEEPPAQPGLNLF
jgi:hypothetical protein